MTKQYPQKLGIGWKNLSRDTYQLIIRNYYEKSNIINVPDARWLRSRAK